MPPFARDVPGGVEIDVLVQPRASRTRAMGEHDGRLKVQVTAPPVEGEANAALVAYLAGALGVRRADVTLVRGEAGRRKTVRIAGMSAAGAVEAILGDGGG